MSKIHVVDPIIRPDLGTNVADIVERAERLHGGNLQVPGMSVGAPCKPCSPFAGRKTSKAATEFGRRQSINAPGMSVGAAGTSAVGGGARQIVDMLSSIGAPACRVWGSDPPGGRDANGCPTKRKVCGAIYPYFSTIAASGAAVNYQMFAKVWFWPLFWVDSSNVNITVARLEYTQDPVFENGQGSGPLDVSNLLGSTAYYGFVPGLPAFDTTVPLEAFLNNADAMNPQNFQGMFIGISIRN